MSELFAFATEELFPEDQAKELTQPLWPELNEVWHAGWSEWNSMSEDHRAMLSQTAFVPSIVVFGFAQAIAKRLFLGREHEGIVECDGLLGVFGFYLHEKVLLRFNVVGQDHLVKNLKSASPHKDAYFRHLPLPKINNSATRLTVGCICNPTKTDVGSVVISCQVGESKYYSFSIDEDGENLAMPSPTISPTPAPFSTQLLQKKPK